MSQNGQIINKGKSSPFDTKEVENQDEVKFDDLDSKAPLNKIKVDKSRWEISQQQQQILNERRSSTGNMQNNTRNNRSPEIWPAHSSASLDLNEPPRSSTTSSWGLDRAHICRSKLTTGTAQWWVPNYLTYQTLRYSTKRVLAKLWGTSKVVLQGKPIRWI